MRLLGWGLAGAVLLGAGAMAWEARKQSTRMASLRARMDDIVQRLPQAKVPCLPGDSRKPIVLLALGQSNAGNHGEGRAPDAQPVRVFRDGECSMERDPLPGATGAGGSIWSRLPRQLELQGQGRPVTLAVLAVDATTVSDWVDSASPLRQRLTKQLAAMRAAQLAPDLVLWQQGEADARVNTDAATYAAGLTTLAALLEAAGSKAPIMLAKSTVCRSAPDEPIRQAVNALIASNQRFLRGPDTDTLGGSDYRSDGCHFNRSGLDAAARMWAASMVALGLSDPLRQ